jgi:hypothetical protein
MCVVVVLSDQLCASFPAMVRRRHPKGAAKLVIEGALSMLALLFGSIQTYDILSKLLPKMNINTRNTYD